LLSAACPHPLGEPLGEALTTGEVDDVFHLDDVAGDRVDTAEVICKPHADALFPRPD